MLIDSNTKYLDPKTDLTFKRVFGQHSDLLISLLNSLLPLKDDQQIQSVTYLPTELVPDATGLKNTIVDVLCRDAGGRLFSVEMQMEWTRAFTKRVLFNASKLYVRQAGEGTQYADLKPVYSLNLVNDVFMHDVPECIHNYKIVHDIYSDKVIEGLHFTFIELPKFNPKTIKQKRMTVLWLRFLTEINTKTKIIPKDMRESPEINKAIDAVRISAFSEDELRSYDKFWDIVRTQRTMLQDTYADGETKGYAKGKAEGILEEKKSTARRLKAMQLPADAISEATGLSTEEIKQL